MGCEFRHGKYGLTRVLSGLSQSDPTPGLSRKDCLRTHHGYDDPETDVKLITRGSDLLKVG